MSKNEIIFQCDFFAINTLSEQCYPGQFASTYSSISDIDDNAKVYIDLEKFDTKLNSEMIKLIDVSPARVSKHFNSESELDKFDCTFQCLFEQKSCQIVGFGTENQCYTGKISTTNGQLSITEYIDIYVGKEKITEDYDTLFMPGLDWNKYGLWIKVNATNSEQCIGYCEFQVVYSRYLNFE